MTAGYELTFAAEQELQDILSYVALQDGLDRALHVHGAFLEAFERLASMPHSGSKRPNLTGDRVRWWPVFNWSVMYDPESSPLAILHILHSAREIERLLRPEH